MDARFMPDVDYTALIEAILALEPCLLTEKLSFDQIAITLGEVGNIWPNGIKG